MIPIDEQPYPLPIGWQWYKLGDIAEIVGGGTPSSKNKFYYENGNIPWITPADLSNYQSVYISQGARNINELGLKKSSAKLFPADTVCLTTRAPIGYVVIAENQLSTNQGFKNLLPSEKYCPKYLYWYLKGNTEFLKSRASGTTFLELSKSRLEQIPIPLPPLDEQQRIVSLLDELFCKLDEAKALAQAVVDGSKLRRAAILHKAFIGELTKLWRDEHGITLDSWQTKKISEVAKIGSGGTPSRKNLKYYCGDIPWVKTGEIFWNEIFDTEEKITSEALKNSSAKIYPVGTVLLAMYGQGLTRGRASILKIESSVNQAVCALCPRDSVNNRYLYYFFMANYWQLREKAYGGNQPNYSATMISKLTISLPSLEEQKEIVRVLEDMLYREQRTKDLALKTVERVELMKKSILARAFRGELGINKNLREI